MKSEIKKYFGLDLYHNDNITLIIYISHNVIENLQNFLITSELKKIENRYTINEFSEYYSYFNQEYFNSYRNKIFTMLVNRIDIINNFIKIDDINHVEKFIQNIYLKLYDSVIENGINISNRANDAIFSNVMQMILDSHSSSNTDKETSLYDIPKMIQGTDLNFIKVKYNLKKPLNENQIMKFLDTNIKDIRMRDIIVKIENIDLENFKDIDESLIKELDIKNVILIKIKMEKVLLYGIRFKHIKKLLIEIFNVYTDIKIYPFILPQNNKDYYYISIPFEFENVKKKYKGKMFKSMTNIKKQKKKLKENKKIMESQRNFKALRKDIDDIYKPLKYTSIDEYEDDPIFQESFRRHFENTRNLEFKNKYIDNTVTEIEKEDNKHFQKFIFQNIFQSILDENVSGIKDSSSPSYMRKNFLNYIDGIFKINHKYILLTNKTLLMLNGFTISKIKKMIEEIDINYYSSSIFQINDINDKLLAFLNDNDYIFEINNNNELYLDMTEMKKFQNFKQYLIYNNYTYIEKSIFSNLILLDFLIEDFSSLNKKDINLYLNVLSYNDIFNFSLSKSNITKKYDINISSNFNIIFDDIYQKCNFYPTFINKFKAFIIDIDTEYIDSINDIVYFVNNEMKNVLKNCIDKELDNIEIKKFKYNIDEELVNYIDGMFPNSHNRNIAKEIVFNLNVNIDTIEYVRLDNLVEKKSQKIENENNNIRNYIDNYILSLYGSKNIIILLNYIINISNDLIKNDKIYLKYDGIYQDDFNIYEIQSIKYIEIDSTNDIIKYKKLFEINNENFLKFLKIKNYILFELYSYNGNFYEYYKINSIYLNTININSLEFDEYNYGVVVSPMSYFYNVMGEMKRSNINIDPRHVELRSNIMIISGEFKKITQMTQIKKDNVLSAYGYNPTKTIKERALKIKNITTADTIISNSIPLLGQYDNFTYNCNDDGCKIEKFEIKNNEDCSDCRNYNPEDVYIDDLNGTRHYYDVGYLKYVRADDFEKKFRNEDENNFINDVLNDDKEFVYDENGEKIYTYMDDDIDQNGDFGNDYYNDNDSSERESGDIFNDDDTYNNYNYDDQFDQDYLFENVDSFNEDSNISISDEDF